MVSISWQLGYYNSGQLYDNSVWMLRCVAPLSTVNYAVWILVRGYCVDTIVYWYVDTMSILSCIVYWYMDTGTWILCGYYQVYNAVVDSGVGVDTSVDTGLDTVPLVTQWIPVV